jgi:hypothetical protein
MAIEWGETYCSKGHKHEGWKMTVHWVPCGCLTAIGGGHHGILCRIRDEDGEECGDFTVPECADETKRKSWSPGRQRS